MEKRLWTVPLNPRAFGQCRSRTGVVTSRVNWHPNLCGSRVPRAPDLGENTEPGIKLKDAVGAAKKGNGGERPGQTRACVKDRLLTVEGTRRIRTRYPAKKSISKGGLAYPGVAMATSSPSPVPWTRVRACVCANPSTNTLGKERQ